MSSTQIKGSCLCGAVSVAIVPGASVQKSQVCHCIDCQKGSGGAFQLNAIYKTPDVEVKDDQKHLKRYMVNEGTFSGKPKEKWFCEVCGCTIFTRPMKYNGAMTVLKTGIFDGGPNSMLPTSEIYCRDRVSFVTPVPDVPHFDTMPPAPKA